MIAASRVNDQTYASLVEYLEDSCQVEKWAQVLPIVAIFATVRFDLFLYQMTGTIVDRVILEPLNFVSVDTNLECLKTKLFCSTCLRIRHWGASGNTG